MATTTNFGWETPDDTDLVKDGAAAIRTSLNGVDSSFVDLKGGTTGQVLSKASGTDLDFTWVAPDDSNAIQNAIVDAKGDLIVGASADTPARLAVGTNGYVLTANSSATNGVEWASPAGGGKILQVVQGTTTTQVSSTSATLADTSLSVSITPSSASSKVVVFIAQTNLLKPTNDTHIQIELIRNSTSVYTMVGLAQAAASGVLTAGIASGHYVDSPATTSAITYKTQFKNTSASGTVYVQYAQNIATSTIIAMEIGA